MPYMELFDKDVINQTFNHNKLLQFLLDKQSYPIKLSKVKLGKGDILFHENKVHDYIYLVVEGLFSAWKDNHIIEFMGQKEFIGTESILSNEDSLFTIEALEDAIVWRFSKEDVMCKLMSTQDGLFFLYSDMKAVNESLTKRNAFQTGTTGSRILGSIIQLGKRYGEENAVSVVLPKSLNKKIIANYSNVTQTTMYYTCRQLTLDGFLEESRYRLKINKSRTKELNNLKVLM
ncbi:Crp/Fnr family transcriptional regulator [Listeria monocytogenes]|nr:Crp/Fnr family transcriptional regulator [Listeria monocytogenes]EAD4839041.1 Crp/Fnr family transcriptional regulator [Listeria monocytogenes]EAD4869058.1 Crp/Fnr family transcriptional regulator [Listeria monocytogenes]EAE1331095.1 Crp/Fnr family transcriptional regulator [Listeria monocytogenes]EAH0457900.1 Crp/Fnr family transcriptional regulator [Listeria monocytogenes]